MQFNQHLPEGHLFFRASAAGSVTVIDRVLTRSCLVSPDQLVESWPVRSVEDIDDVAIAAMLDLKPELILLGTGSHQVFPSAAVRAAVLAKRIGIEVMDNAAACRTFNLLAEEGRRVVAAIMLPG